jgi:hypothetical protein
MKIVEISAVKYAMGMVFAGFRVEYHVHLGQSSRRLALMPNPSFQLTVKKLRFLPSTEFAR